MCVQGGAVWRIFKGECCYVRSVRQEATVQGGSVVLCYVLGSAKCPTHESNAFSSANSKLHKWRSFASSRSECRKNKAILCQNRCSDLEHILRHDVYELLL
jgi:hypothetical protein